MKASILFVAVLVVVVPLVNSVFVEPQWCTAIYTRRQLYYTTRCYYCGWWWWWARRCCYRKCNYRTVTATYRKCCDGYTGTRCNVPECNPPCSNRGVCVAKNKCDCPSSFSGSTCQTRKCSWAKDCYPGICNGAVQCVCSSEFDGSNCQTMKEGPLFSECLAKLIENKNGEDKVVATANCTYIGENTKEYTSANEFTHVVMEWKPTYRKLEDLPPNPREGYLRTFRVGVIDTYAQLVLRDTVGSIAKSERITCPSSASWSLPQETIICDTRYHFTEGLRHQQELTLSMFGTTGGFKDVRNQDTTGSYEMRQIRGVQESLSAIFLFDLEAPFHCKEDDTCESDGIQPIVIDADIRKDPDVTVSFVGWNDTDSGLRGFKYYVYPLSLFPEDGMLQNSTEPALTKAYDLFDENVNSSFKLPGPGLYSILGEIMDFADNKRYTRAFVLYSNSSHGIEETEEAIQVTPGPNTDQIDKAFWLNTLSGDITISWRGRYKNNFISDNHYNLPIGPLHHPRLLDFTHGNLTASGTTAAEGITGYSYSIIHRIQQETRRRRAVDPPTQWTDLAAGQSEVTLNLNRNDGDGYTFWVKATDMLNNELTDFWYIRADSSPPNVAVDSLQFIKNEKNDENGFFSSVSIVTIDTESGIYQMEFELHDILHPDDTRLIQSGVQDGQLSEEDDVTCSTTGVCTCTNLKECYNNPQKVYINNCWFKEFLDVPVLFQAKIINRARLHRNVTLNLGEIQMLDGIGEYPAARSLRVKDVFGYSAIFTWYLPVSCYDIRSIHIELTGGRGGSAQLTARETEVELKDLVPYTEYTANLYLVYEGRRDSDSISVTFNTGEAPNGDQTGISTGTIVGIVVGVLVLVCIVVIVVMIVVRIRQKKPAVPQRIRTMKDNVVNRISRRFGHETHQQHWAEDGQDPPPPYPGGIGRDSIAKSQHGMTLNVAYTSGPKLRDFEDDLYTYGELETDPNAKWKHSDDKVTLGKTIHSGRFAEIREGVLRDREGARKVAIKMVKNHSAENDLLMKAKMNFMATVVPNHNNIVNFVGAITEGPILLLELCETTLKEWLKKIIKVTDDVEDNMINFSTDIARGMQHLHDNDIIHRRLGARNILLKNVPLMGRPVAKVMGFGPMKGEQTGGDNVESEKERIPIKWMAYEQLGINKGQKRPYTPQTDIWSYGVTMWEIFSKGDVPFGNVKSSEVRKQLEKGVRLECPLHCSDEMYNELMKKCWMRDPKKRPSFSEITVTLERMFHGAPDGDEYYDDNPRDLTDQELYDDTRPI